MYILRKKSCICKVFAPIKFKKYFLSKFYVKVSSKYIFDFKILCFVVFNKHLNKILPMYIFFISSFRNVSKERYSVIKKIIYFFGDSISYIINLFKIESTNSKQNKS